ncbi:MAG: hypothetical protein DHS20C14_14840 [Phycisphaeraceae bacterium]|nr:MAG: hypothetical protein DHS20C14_14840 [Phycisphaeraceae bacterium]
MIETLTIPGTTLASATLGEGLPQGGAVALVVWLVAGIVLWLFGGKVLKPAFLLIGAAAGGFAGVVLLPLTGLPEITIAGVALGPGMIGLVIGAIVGGLVSIGLFRVIITLSAGVVFAVAGTFAGLVYLQHVPEGSGDVSVAEIVQGAEEDAGEALRDSTDSMRDQASEALRDLAEGIGTDAAERGADEAASGLLSEEDTEQLKEHVRNAAEQSRAFLAYARDAAVDEWDARTSRERLVILGSGIVGMLVGLIGGVIFPRRATALITSLLGGAIWLAAAVALLRSLAGLGADALAFSPQTWAIVWIGTAVIGVSLQLGVIGRKGGITPFEGDDEDEEDE